MPRLALAVEANPERVGSSKPTNEGADGLNREEQDAVPGVLEEWGGAADAAVVGRRAWCGRAASWERRGDASGTRRGGGGAREVLVRMYESLCDVVVGVRGEACGRDRTGGEHRAKQGKPLPKR
ncbi:hypothetical protein AB1Y20_007232 [Prymnesium parvum]|uniref:Uncharacterized protein n=1 Tax=Prymnesium parvum TaxID=97485 RepID=A0AB34IWG9_PRYPA